ncbi:ferric reductase-like transmembrane domain-containing protein [Raoultibacter timonensis]|uniref:ferric reductase-like transmembrane domain-containing protein n=1 Tax=Raoultibacter timonensis TaxID=1907662 RepID=UPI000C81DC1E|nr:ferric reductase-like transmembrane domain-containing protein [Raoultibacter timonensis]
MEYLVALLGTTAFVVASSLLFKMRSAPLYIAAAALIALYAAGSYGMLPAPLWKAVFPLVRKGLIALSLFTIVMFIGVFRESSAARNILQPLRKDLAVTASALAILHIAAQVQSYLPNLLAMLGDSPLHAMQLATVSALLALGAILTVTSFERIRKLMPGKTWKRLQRASYVFFALIAIHIVLVLAPAAAAEKAAAWESIVVYLGVALIYTILRIRKSRFDDQRIASRRTIASK